MEMAAMRDEISKLQKENEELARKAARQGPRRQGAGWRNTLAVVLIVIGAVLAPLSAVAVWLNRQVVNTDIYVETVRPLSRDPAVRSAVANGVTTTLFARIDSEKLARDALPPRADFLAAPLANGLQTFARQAAERALASPQFDRIWVAANREAHGAFVKAFIDQGGGPVSLTQEGKVTLDLGPTINRIKGALSQRGITVFNDVSLSGANKQYTLFQSPALARIRRFVGLLNTLAIWLPLSMIAFFGAAIGVSTDRRRSILWIGVGLTIGMVVLLVAIAVGRSYYLSAVTSSLLPSNAAAAFFDIIVRNLLTAIRTVTAVGAVIAIGAALAGPSTTAVRVRSTAKNAIRQVGTTWDFGPFGAWIARQKTILRAIGVVVGLLVLIAIGRPTPLTVLSIALGILVYLGLIEFFGRGSAGMRPTAVTPK